MKASARVALCGMCAAVCTVILFLTGLAPMATIALPALAGCVLIPVTAQLGVKWGLGVYAVCTVLELLWVPDREAAVYFALFFGYYPVLTAVVGRIARKGVRMLVKVGIFNLALVLSMGVLAWLLRLPMERMPGFLAVGLWLLANGMFLLYDLCLEKFIGLYYARIHRRLRGMLLRR